MKIGVLSDTHIATLALGDQLARRLFSGCFADVSAILHAGDLVHPELESCFYPCPWYAVRGNMDHLAEQTPVKRVLHLAGKRVGMVHGWGSPLQVEENVLGSFAEQMPDVLIFGHSHLPVCRMVDRTLLLNPGSPTDPRLAAGPSVGLLTLADRVTAEIIRLD
ncbi:MAG: metallophosphoesterase [Pelovirga sp.]